MTQAIEREQEIIETITGKVPLETSASIPNTESDYTIDRDELMRLRRKAKIPMWLYVYFALNISYSTTMVNVDIKPFCDLWGISRADFDSAKAQLSKKGMIEDPATQLTLNLFPVDED